VQFALDKPMAAALGSTFVYSSGVTMVFAEILRQLTGRSLAKYAERGSAAPHRGALLEAHADRPPGSRRGLFLAPRDHAWIAKLYLDGGRVDGRQFVPQDWVRESLAPATPSTYPEATRAVRYRLERQAGHLSAHAQQHRDRQDVVDAAGVGRGRFMTAQRPGSDFQRPPSDRRTADVQLLSFEALFVQNQVDRAPALSIG